MRSRSLDQDQDLVYGGEIHIVVAAGARHPAVQALITRGKPFVTLSLYRCAWFCRCPRPPPASHQAAELGWEKASAPKVSIGQCHAPNRHLPTLPLATDVRHPCQGEDIDRIVLIRLSPEEANQRFRRAVLIREYEGKTWPNGSAVAIAVWRVTPRWPCSGRS